LKTKILLPEQVVKLLSSSLKRKYSFINASGKEETDPNKIFEDITKDAKKVYEKKYKEKVGWEVFLDICLNIIRILLIK